MKVLYDGEEFETSNTHDTSRLFIRLEKAGYLKMDVSFTSRGFELIYRMGGVEYERLDDVIVELLKEGVLMEVNRWK